MTDPTADLLPEGLSDQLQDAAARGSRLRRAVLDTFDSHGYARLHPPLIEFEKSLASRMDGVKTKRMFRFVDPASLRTLALRNDITPQIGRITATSLADAVRPLRVCYAGSVVSISGDGLDPTRERTQIGAEIIGSDNVAAVAEAVSVAVDALGAAGAQGVSVDFTLPDLVDVLSQKALPLASEKIADVRRALDAKDAGGLKQVGGEAYLPLLYATGPFETAIARLRAVDAGGALASRITGLCEIAQRLGDRVRITLDPTERHGFEYQSWFGFTLYSTGARGALGRGGTYRIANNGGPGAEVATGFSLYPDLLAEAAGGVMRDLLFLPLGHDPQLAAALRSEGWCTLAALDSTDDAAALGCTHVLAGSGPTAL